MLKEKTKTKKRRLYHFCDLINDFDFYNFIIHKNGVYYYIIPKTTDNKNDFEAKLKYTLEKYENTLKMEAASQYAPEQKQIILFISK